MAVLGLRPPALVQEWALVYGHGSVVANSWLPPRIHQGCLWQSTPAKDDDSLCRTLRRIVSEEVVVGVVGELRHPDESAFSKVVGLVRGHMVQYVLGHVPHAKWERRRSAIEHDVRTYRAATGELRGHVGEGVGDAVQVVMDWERLELALQARVVEDVGSRNRRGIQPQILEARTLQSATTPSLAGHTGAWTCTKLPSMAMMKSRLPKWTRAPGAHPSALFAI